LISKIKFAEAYQEATFKFVFYWYIINKKSYIYLYKIHTRKDIIRTIFTKL